ncbi:MAG TPA: alpha/beta hydrolase domain-containing protein [Gammaproteobacteria bacterium]|nr:alpha/beta hydrolase domain-containing protein [Gammaproteobacteria bacterium]
MRMSPPALLVMLAAWPGAPAQAEVSAIEIEKRSVVLDGRGFGAAGAYEKLAGSLVFSLDPSQPANAAIVDLARGPRDADGRVSARADFMVLQPVDSKRRRGVGLLEVSNRGGKASLPYFNDGRRSVPDPATAEDFGDGLLMREGLTVIWVGWQHDVPDRPELLRLEVPVATGDDGALTGLVRSDWVVDERVSTLALGHRGHRPYPAAAPDDLRNILTARSGREAPRRVVPRSDWRFANADGAAAADGGTHIHATAGFEPGNIYELVYVARDPRIAGIGLAAVRDAMAYAKHDPSSPFPVEHGIAFGVSQTGRFLRHFLYQGFNADEQGRRVFDGMLIHSAGAGRGSFNHRFAQPSRDAHRYSAFFYPTDLFPFSSHTQSDAQSGLRDGLVATYRGRLLPRIFYVNTGYEYWGRAASLIHMRVDGRRDLPPMRNERIYHLASAQHYVAAWPPAERHALERTPAWSGNPLDFLVNLRALLVRLVDWVADDRSPPASEYPTIGRGTLVMPAELALPGLPGLEKPVSPHVAYRADYGTEWDEGIITREPPHIDSAFPIRVPQVDALGNELGGIRNVDIAVPLASYLPWSLRRGLPNPEEMADFRGTLIPLPVTDADAERNADPRPSIESLYPGRDVYIDDVRVAARALVERGYLLEEDVERVSARAAERWRWAVGYAQRPVMSEGDSR